MNRSSSYLLCALALPLLYSSYRRYAERKAFQKYTALEDLDTLEEQEGNNKRPGTAVIIGGSLAGLFTARICSNYFENVVIIEPDEGADEHLPSNGSRPNDYGSRAFVNRRSRIMQTFTIHAYQPFLLMSLRSLFSEFDKKLTHPDVGGRIGIRDPNFSFSGTELRVPTNRAGLPVHPKLPKGPGVPETMWLSRAAFEPFLRRLIRETCRNVTWITGTATDFVLDKDKEKILGVVYNVKGEAGSLTQDAELVADCTGIGRRGHKWLESNGLPMPSPLSYDPQFRTVTAWFDLDDEKRLNLPTPYGPTSELFFALLSDPSLGNQVIWAVRGEGNRVGISAGAWGLTASDLPHSPEEFKEYYRSVQTLSGNPPDEWFCNLVDYLAKDDGWESSYFVECKIPPASTVNYHLACKLSSNFVAIGDSAMRANPVYGLGTTKAMVGSVTLSGVLHEARHLSSLPPTFSRQFFQRQHDRTVWHWDGGRITDYGYPTTIPCPGETLELGKSTRKLTKSFITLVTKNETAAAGFYYSRQWLYPASVSMSTMTLLRTFWTYWTTPERKR